MNLPPPVWIDRPEPLQSLALTLGGVPRLAVDTESNSLHAYREHVCLLQISTPARDFLVDPLTLADLSPLAPIFADPAIEKIFHAAEYDLIGLRRDFGFQVVNLFDTMLAARALGIGQVGLGHLLAERFGLAQDKRLQRADWARRPLTPEMIHYARQDTHFLFALRDELERELRAAGRWELACEDFLLACLPEEPSEEQVIPLWQRMDARRELSPRQQTVLNELILEREAIAARLDRPVFKVVQNDVLFELARALPRTPGDLYRAGLSHKQTERFGREFLEAVKRGLSAPLVRLYRVPRPSRAFLRRLEVLREWRKQRAAEMHVESDVVLPRRFLHALARSGPRTASELEAILKLAPWRLEHFGQEILTVLKD